MKILVTGGAGYIGSHTVVELLKHNHEIVIVDNFSNSHPESISRIEKITNNQIPFYELDLCDTKKLSKVFKDHKIDSVIHFAGLKSVGESISKPFLYYRNNINSTLSLLEVMRKHNINKLVFSSSAAVYGVPERLPITEDCRVGVGITNPYGQTKFMIEQILKDAHIAQPELEITILRYFNPIGAHDSGLIGENPNDIPNNILPYISHVAVGRLEKVSVFGNDYDTHDGTGVRDYIHVNDLASGHVAAIDNIKPGISIYNLGSGNGTSVLELISAFNKASGKTINYVISDRRPGDVAACYASAEKAKKELGWTAKKTIQDACADSWRWQSQNPNGYDN